MQPAALKVLSGGTIIWSALWATAQKTCYHSALTTCEDFIMSKLLLAFLLLAAARGLAAQAASDQLSELPKPHDYALKRSSSYDRTGGNADARPVPAGSTINGLDANGPARVS